VPTAILWLRRDLRRRDLPALNEAHGSADGGRVLPVFVLDPRLLDQSPVRTHLLICALRAAQRSFDGAIVLRRGRPEEQVPRLASEVEAASVHVSAESTPYGRHRDDAVRAALGEEVPLVATGSPYAVGPGTIRNVTGDPYKVFTPFSRAWREHGWPDPAEPPGDTRWHRQAGSDELPDPPDTGGEVDLPEVGEQAALERWAEFLADDLADYDEGRDRPALDTTSRMSVHLKYGTIHPRTMLGDLRGRRGKGVDRFVSELCWREFYADVLWHRPDSAWGDLRRELGSMAYDDPGSDDDAARSLAAWQQGRTGYPFVDAGMRQLLHQGWMHNRVRMVTASFLVKDLHIWWPHGARHFLRLLIDGDVASNNHGWQWTAGTGTDAAPYFRVFNPVSQGQRFDADGDYVRRWVPELRHLPGKAAHEPWAHEEGYAEGYPERIVDHKAAREEALARYQQARG
jgi:deoxyribodipyrimidine photo-lyase